jgi:hypothetical protein
MLNLLLSLKAISRQELAITLSAKVQISSL